MKIVVRYIEFTNRFKQFQNDTYLSHLADIPFFMGGGDRIIGGSVAPSMIPWQVAVLDGDLNQFCGGTILDAFTILSAASCNITVSHSIRAGSLIKNTGGQVSRS